MHVLKILDIEVYEDNLKVHSREGEHREFKQEYNKKAVADYLKAMAAFTNADGGEIVFGITDSPRTVIGINAEFITDAELSDQLSNYFEPHISFEIDSGIIAGKKLYKIMVRKSYMRPVVCKKTRTVKRQKRNNEFDETVLEESAIYYRYGAKSDKIKYAELQLLLEERNKQTLNGILQNLEIMAKVGFHNVGVIDVTKPQKSTDLTSLYVSKETAKDLNFIDKGRFSEIEGEGIPAYMVVGSVQIREGVEVEIPERDRILPTEVAKQLDDAFRKVFPEDFATKNLHPSHLSDIAKSLGMRSNKQDEYDIKYCYYDKTTHRFFYRTAFVNKIKELLRTPLSRYQFTVQA